MKDGESGDEGSGEAEPGGLGMRKVLNLGREIVVRYMVGRRVERRYVVPFSRRPEQLASVVIPEIMQLLPCQHL